ncbi:hypothetical protein KAX02_06755 [candidate division WOR-3 bacterium]|nr:hypothetical protein [candidate division WOR-3 bacterium]
MIRTKNYFPFNICVILLTFTFLISSSYANEDIELPRKQYNWLYIGTGRIMYNSEIRFSIDAGFSVLHGTTLITLRDYGYYYFNGNEESLALFEPYEAYIEIDLLYGHCNKTQDYIAAISTGLGFVLGKFGDFEFKTIGLPIVAQFFWTPTGLLGIGISLFVNLNPKKIYSDISICAQIGILR